MLAAMLLVAAFAASPARAQDAATEVPAPPDATVVAPPPTDASPPPTVPDSGPAVDAPTVPQTGDQPTDPPTGDQTPVDPGTGTDQPVQEPDRASARQPSHDVSGTASDTTPAPSVPTTSSDTTKAQTVAPSSDGYPGNWGGQDTFVVDKSGDPPTGGSAIDRGPISGIFAGALASRSSSATRLEAKARRSHAIAQVTAMGVPPGSGHQLPSRNPFFNMLSGPGGAATGLALASVLAVLGVAFVLPRHRSWNFRLPTVSWSPSAYVPPIELPG